MKSRAPLLAFNRGEVSKLALARVDLAKLALSAACQINWMPFVLGPMMLRPGLAQVGNTASDNACCLIDFIYSNSDSALVELTDSVMRVWIDDALVTRPAVTAAIVHGDFSSGLNWALSAGTGTANINSTVSGALYLAAGAGGDSASCAQSVGIFEVGVEHALRIVVSHGPVDFMCGSTVGGDEYIGRTTLDTGTHSLVFTPTATFTVEFISALRYGVTVDSITVESAGVMTVPTPWTASDLATLTWTQKRDVIYVAAYGKAQYKIERRGTRPNAHGWSVAAYLSDDGPFDDANANGDRSRTIVASDTVGSVTLTAVSTSFTASDVGAVIRLEESDLSLVPGWKPSEAITIPTTNITGTAAGNIGDFTTPANAFDGNAGTSTTHAGSLGYLGRNWAAGQSIYSVAISGFTYSPITIANMTLTLYGKNGLPASATDGTPLGSVTFSGGFSNATIYSSNTASTFTHIWVAFSPAVAVAYQVAEMVFTQFNAGATAIYRRSFGRVYQALAGTSSGVNAPTHSAGDVLSETGGMLWRYIHGLFGVVRVTAVASASSASADVLMRLPISVASTPASGWTRGDWNANVAGYPSAVAFQEGRLWWFGTKFWGSRSGDFTSYAQTDDVEAALGDSGAIVEDFGEGPADRVNWAVGLSRLLAGREGTVASIRSSSFDTPLTPTDLAVKDCSQEPTDRLRALKIGKRAVFVSPGRRVYELFFNPQAADYDDRDLTRYNLDIAASPLVDAAGALQPEPILYFPRTDGQVACLLYDPRDEVEAWWRIMTLGVVENVRRLPRSGGGDDRVYFCVRRVVNGSTKRFIERLAQRSECVGGSLNRQADCYIAVSQGLNNVVSGLSTLEGQAVVVWANGKSLGTYTVGGGNIELTEAVTSAIVGLGGVVKVGSMQATLYGGTEPDQVFSDLSATLTLGTAYNGYPAEIWADVGGTGKLVHLGTVSVSAGAVTLPNGATASIIVAMLGYVAPFMSAKLAYAAQGGGTPLTQKKQVEQVGLVLYDSHYQGLTVGQRFDVLDPPPAIEEGRETAADTVWSEYDEPAFKLPGEWDTDARLCLLAQAPKPCRVGAAVVGGTSKEQ